MRRKLSLTSPKNATNDTKLINWEKIHHALAHEGPEVAWQLLIQEIDEEQLWKETENRPELQKYLRFKSLILYHLKRYHEALETLERLLVLIPHDGKAWQLAFKLGLVLGDEETIRKSLEELQHLGIPLPKMEESQPSRHLIRTKKTSKQQLTRASRIVPPTEIEKTVKVTRDENKITRKHKKLKISPGLRRFLTSLQRDPSLTETFEITWKARTESSDENFDLIPLSIINQPQLEDVLKNLGFRGLYPFQKEALDAILHEKPHDVLLIAPTGAGKTEAAMIPVIKKLIAASKLFNFKKNEKRVRVLVMYPTKALSRDQLLKLQRLLEPFSLTVMILDGDTNFVERSHVFKNPPDVIVTNLDMVHHHLIRTPRFIKLLANLEFLIVDELHLHGGLRGGILHHVITRLKRVSKNTLQVIGMSATIANPRHFFERLMGHHDGQERVIVISATKDTAPRPQQACVVLSVRDSLAWYQGLLQLVQLAVNSGAKTLVFLDSRKEVERLHAIVHQQRPTIARVVGMHRAGLSPQERQRMERRFRLPARHPDSLTCLVTTSTLEVGIDVGDVDVVITTPHDPEHLWQRIGRAGRKGQLALALIVLPPNDPITNMIKQHPRVLFREMTPLKPFINDEHLAMIHLVAAARDQPLHVDEIRGHPQWHHVLPRAVKEGYLMRDLEGRYHVTKTGRSFLLHVEFHRSRERLIACNVDFLTDEERTILKQYFLKHPRISPNESERHKSCGESEKSSSMVSLHRSKGDLFATAVQEIVKKICSRDDLPILTERELPRALQEFYPGAIYLHLGKYHEILAVIKHRSCGQGYRALVVPCTRRAVGQRVDLPPSRTVLVETVPIIIKQLQVVELKENEPLTARVMKENSSSHQLKNNIEKNKEKMTEVESKNLNDVVRIKITPARVRLTTMVVGTRKVVSPVTWVTMNSSSSNEQEQVDSSRANFNEMSRSFVESDEGEEEVRLELNPPLKHVSFVNGIFIQFPRPSLRTIMEHLANNSTSMVNGSLLRMNDHHDVISGYITMGFHTVTHLLRHAVRIHLGLKDDDLSIMHVGGSNALFVHSHVSRGVIDAFLENLPSLLVLAREIASTCECSRIRQQALAGCPRCTHSRACTVRNDLLHKELALNILNLVLHPSSRSYISPLHVETLNGKLYS